MAIFVPVGFALRSLLKRKNSVTVTENRILIGDLSASDTTVPLTIKVTGAEICQLLAYGFMRARRRSAQSLPELRRISYWTCAIAEFFSFT